MEIDSENVVQAVVIMDPLNNYFTPISNSTPIFGLLLVAGVPLINYILESLALGGVGETILFCCQDGAKIKEHIRQCKEEKALWSVSMDVQVLMSDTCQSMGDVMRDIDAAGLIRGNFVLAGANSITNIPFAALMEQHKQTYKQDKGAAMTLIYKKVSWDHPLISCDKPTLLAADARTNKVLLHQKYNPTSVERSISLPLEMVLNYSKVKFHNNLADANIALCSPAVPRLFSDNVDFQTRDDIIHGILRNEEILASSLYYLLLKEHQYAADVTNWKTEQIICRYILHDWEYPLSIQTASFSQNNYPITGNHNFREKRSSLSGSFPLVERASIGTDTIINANTIISEDSVIGNNCVIGSYVTITGSHLMNNVIVHDNTKIISNSVIGNNCVIGNYVTITGSHLMNNVIVHDNTKIINSFIDNACIINADCALEGVTLGKNVIVPAGSHLIGSTRENLDPDKGRSLLKSTSESTE